MGPKICWHSTPVFDITLLILTFSLHILCLKFGWQVSALYGTAIKQKGLLYLHNIISHFPSFYEICDFRNGSTEPG